MDKKVYILVDSLNLFFRTIHVSKGKDIDTIVGMSMHVLLNSVRKAWEMFSGNHVVFCLEGSSWRKDFYPPYKANRQVKISQLTLQEQENNRIIFESYDKLIDFISNKTNCTVLREENSEADDLIAIWIREHPDDEHIVLSTDSDFHQLIAQNVKQYSFDQIISLDGFKNIKTDDWVIDKKTGNPKEAVDPEYALFEKCVRGDSSDNIFSAYPGARKKGTKNKVGILEAFEDRNSKGYNYNNFMLQRWTDHKNEEHRVRDDFERNRILIDLTAQPNEIVEKCKKIIDEARNKETKNQIGLAFMKFCAKWELIKIADFKDYYLPFLKGKIMNDRG